MATYRRRGRKPTMRRRRVYKKRSSGIRRMVRSTLNRFIETKKHEHRYTEVQLNSVGANIGYIDQGQELTQGDSYANLTGHLVNGVGFLSKFLLHNNSTNPQFLRHLILVNKRGHTSTDYRTGASLFESMTGDENLSGFGSNAYLTARINKEYYKVLQDHIIKLGGSSDIGKIYAYRKWIPLKGRRFTYNGSATRPSRNNIIELWLTAESDDDATGEVVELTGEQTFYYKDA